MSSPSSPNDRPAWMTALAALCALTVVVSIFRDLFLPANRWMEIWFGFEITGWPALVTAPLHWAIFATGAYGFWNQRPWAAPCAAGYLVYAALAHLVWSEVSPHGRGIAIGIMQAAALSSVALVVFGLGRHKAG
jgi:hypothetical protein